jgi:hypothetical protein
LAPAAANSPARGSAQSPAQAIAGAEFLLYSGDVKSEDLHRYRIERAAMQAALGTTLIEFAFEPRHSVVQGCRFPWTSMLGRVPRITSTTPVACTQSPGPTE